MGWLWHGACLGVAGFLGWLAYWLAGWPQAGLLAGWLAGRMASQRVDGLLEELFPCDPSWSRAGCAHAFLNDHGDESPC